MSSLDQIRLGKTAPSWLVATLGDADLTGLVFFAAIGLLISLSVMLYFPDSSAIIAQAYQF
jgi:hypothetical protein